jgi:hypothetical protein
MLLKPLEKKGLENHYAINASVLSELKIDSNRNLACLKPEAETTCMIPYVFKLGFGIGLYFIRLKYRKQISASLQFLVNSITYSFDSKKEPIKKKDAEEEHLYQLSEGLGKTLVESVITNVSSGSYYLTKLSQAVPKGITTATMENIEEISNTAIETGRSLYDKIIEKKK